MRNCSNHPFLTVITTTTSWRICVSVLCLNHATGQVLGSLGYNCTQNISTAVGYRVLYAYDKQNNAGNGSFRFQSWIYGPFAGFKYSF